MLKGLLVPDLLEIIENAFFTMFGAFLETPHANYEKKSASCAVVLGM